MGVNIKVRKQELLFKKKEATNFYQSGPIPVKPARSKLQKFFCFSFVNKKEDPSFLSLIDCPGVTSPSL
jgi:hypothetical protein